MEEKDNNDEAPPNLISNDEKKLKLEQIWDELQLSDDPHHLPNRVQQRLSFTNTCVLSIVACLISSDFNNKQFNEKSASYLLLTFKKRNITSFWHRIDEDRQIGLLYGLFLLSQSSCELMKDTSLSVLRELMTEDMTCAHSHGSKPFYSVPTLEFIKQMDKAQNEFRAIIENWQEVVVVGAVGWEGMVNGGNLVVSFIKGEDDGMSNEAWKVLACLVMYIQSSHMPLLIGILAQVLEGGGIVDAYGSDKEYNLLFQSVYADLLNHKSKPGEDIGGEEMIDSLFIKLNPLVRDVFCALLIRLLEKVECRDKAIFLIASIEKLYPGENIWVAGAPLVDRLLLLLKQSKDKDKDPYVLAILQCLIHLSKAENPLHIKPLEELLDELINIFTSYPTREVQLLAGQCLEKFLNFDFYPLPYLGYRVIQKSLRSNNFPRFDTELQALLSLCQGILDSNLEQSYPF